MKTVDKSSSIANSHCMTLTNFKILMRGFAHFVILAQNGGIRGGSNLLEVKPQF